ncbi:MAG: hypothetical protein WBO23_16575 [Burkholderiales bacterium]
MMKAATAAFAIAGLLSACTAQSQNSTPRAATRADEASSMSPREAEAVDLLRWLDAADPVGDSKRAIDQGRPALLTLGGRGASLPGIAAGEQSRLTPRCPMRVLPGATDTVRGDTHLRYLQRARDYAERYNRAMLAFCSP